MSMDLSRIHRGPNPSYRWHEQMRITIPFYAPDLSSELSEQPPRQSVSLTVRPTIHTTLTVCAKDEADVCLVQVLSLTENMSNRKRISHPVPVAADIRRHEGTNAMLVHLGSRYAGNRAGNTELPLD